MVDIFVYGTLKPGEINYHKFCEGRVLKAQVAYAKGKLYQIPVTYARLPMGYPAMTAESGWVEGVLLTFKNADIFADLDQLEDYQAGRSPSDNEYQREILTLYDRNYQPFTQAWGYVMLPAKVAALGGYPLQQSSWSSSH